MAAGKAGREEGLMPFKDFSVNASFCPKCGKELDATMPVGHEERPQAGDVTVCIYCGIALNFNSAGGLEQLSDDDLVEMALDHRKNFSILMKMQNLIGLMLRGGTKSDCKD